MKKFLYTCILFSFSCLGLHAYNIDSLVAVIGQVPIEKQHEKIYAELVFLKESTSQDAIELGNYWINILNQKQLHKEAAQTILVTGEAYYRVAEYGKSIQYSLTARNLFKMNGDIKGEAQALRDIGFCYSKMGQYEEAYQSLEKSILVFEKIQDHKELAGCFNHMGNLVEKWTGDYDLAVSLYKKSMGHAQLVDDIESISYSLEFIGIIKSEEGMNDSAIYYFDESLKLRKQLDLQLPLAISYTNIAEVMNKKGDYKNAEQYFKKALSISSGIQYNDLTNFIYENLSKVHKKRGNLDSAITYLELHQALQDSLFNLQKTKEFAEIKEKYESELKEEKIRTLNTQIDIKNQKYQKRIYFFIAIIVSMAALVLIGVFVFLSFYYKEQKKQALEKVEQEKERNKMIIEAEEKERTRIAKDLHDSVGQMLAALKMNLNSIHPGIEDQEQLKKTAGILDDTIVEMRSISHAMMPESLMKNGLAKALIDIGSRVETGETKVLVNVENWKGWDRTGEYVVYRVVQELLNNTLKHAAATEIHIELNQFDDEINLIYEDNGKGFDVHTTKVTGIGLKNMLTRVSSMNGQLELDSTPGYGTTAIISIPLKPKA